MKHAVCKAEAMQVPLSLDPMLQELLEDLVGQVQPLLVERMVLRPSAAVVEASDYLSHKHDARAEWISRGVFMVSEPCLLWTWSKNVGIFLEVHDRVLILVEEMPCSSVFPRVWTISRTMFDQKSLILSMFRQDLELRTGCKTRRR